MRRLAVCLAVALLLSAYGHAAEEIDVRLDILYQRDQGQATITASAYDIGHPDTVFDGDYSSLYRSAAVNPAFAQVAFASSTTTTEFRTIYTSLGNYRWKVEKADTQADMDSQTGSWAEIVPWQASAGDDVLRSYVLVAPVTAKIYKLVAQRLTGDDYVHITQWELHGPVLIESIDVQPAAQELPHPSRWPYKCLGQDSADVRYDATEDVDWSSTNTGVATVSGDGTVTTVWPGTIEIHADLGVLNDHGDLTVVDLYDPPGSFAATPYYSTAHLTWNAGPSGTVGYVIYRRTALGSYPAQPTAYVGPREDHTDCSLTPGQTYYWKVAAYDKHDNILTGYAETSATLLTSSAGLKRIAAPKLVMALYHGEMTEAEKDAAVAGLQLGLDWYYRNSEQRFFMDVTWMLIDAPVPDKVTGYSAIVDDLRSRGVKDGQYDLCFTTGAGLGYCLGGYLIFNGTTRASKGFVCGVPYPTRDPNTNTNVAWAFTHEIHHALDSMVDDAGGDDMLFCHFPWNYPSPLDGAHVDWGTHYDGISQIMRVYDDYTGWTNVNHGDSVEVWDSDGDDMADSDSRVPMDEARFGSTIGVADSDGDGLTDGHEYDRYVYTALDPNDDDSDDDGRPDGSDPQPLYAVPDVIAYTAAPPSINGPIEAKWSLIGSGYFFTNEASDFELEVYANYDDTFLYLGFKSTQQLYYRISLDGSGHLGRFESDVQHPDADWNDKATWYGDVYGDGNHIEVSTVGAGPLIYGVGSIPGAYMQTRYVSGRYQTEARIPKVLPHGAAYTYFAPGAPTVEGLQLVPGRIVGLNITMSTTAGSEFAGSWTSLFEPHGFVDFELSGIGDIDGDGLDAAAEGAASTDPLDPDTEGDGMDDGWELAHSLDPLADDASADPDNDGYTNIEEYLSGTDPQNAASNLHITSITTGASVTLTWATAYGRTYVVESKTSIDGSWGEEPTSVMTELDGGPGLEDTESWIDMAAHSTVKLYRIRLVTNPAPPESTAPLPTEPERPVESPRDVGKNLDTRPPRRGELGQRRLPRRGPS